MDGKKSKKFLLEMRNLKQTELQRLKNRAEDKSKNDRARRRTKKVQEEKKRSSETEDHYTVKKKSVQCTPNMLCYVCPIWNTLYDVK